MIKFSDLKIDPKSLGNQFLLVDVTPTYRYVNGIRGDVIIGYKYICALPHLGFRKLPIKVEGEKLIEVPENGYEQVVFSDLEVYLYNMNNSVQVGARASGISLAKKVKE